MVQEAVKAKFKGKKYLPCRTRPIYPSTAEREYRRVVNAYGDLPILGKVVIRKLEVKNMKLKNTGNKIVNVGSTILMPDQEMDITAELATTPGIKALARKGIVSVVGTIPAPDTKSDRDSEPEKPAKKGRKSKSEDACANTECNRTDAPVEPAQTEDTPEIQE
jgi:hypothetical protein